MTKMTAQRKKHTFLPWLVDKINNGKYPDLKWVDTKAGGLCRFQVPWKHKSNSGWNSEDERLFRDWSDNQTPGKTPQGLKGRFKSVLTKQVNSGYLVHERDPDITDLRVYSFTKRGENKFIHKDMDSDWISPQASPDSGVPSQQDSPHYGSDKDIQEILDSFQKQELNDQATVPGNEMDYSIFPIENSFQQELTSEKVVVQPIEDATTLDHLGEDWVVTDTLEVDEALQVVGVVQNGAIQMDAPYAPMFDPFTMAQTDVQTDAVVPTMVEEMNDSVHVDTPVGDKMFVRTMFGDFEMEEFRLTGDKLWVYRGANIEAYEAILGMEHWHGETINLKSSNKFPNIPRDTQAVLAKFKDGLRLRCESGHIYATRLSKCRVFASTPEGYKKLDRHIETKIFDFNQFLKNFEEGRNPHSFVNISINKDLADPCASLPLKFIVRSELAYKQMDETVVMNAGGGESSTRECDELINCMLNSQED